MTWLFRAFRSSIGRKQLVALTGLALCGFLVTHLAGNLLILVGPEAFDGYAEAMTSNKAFLYTAEVILFVTFATHIGLAVMLTVENRRARPRGYAVNATSGEATVASSTMIYSGVVILVFLILHLLHFKFSWEEGQSLHALVIETYQNPLQVIWYVACMGVLGLHLSHGVQSAVRSLGISHPRYTPIVRASSIGFAVVISVGFAILPIYAYFFGASQ